MFSQFKFADKSLDLSVPQVMGVLNVTPDSFSDGGKFNSLDHALSQACAMVEQGASIIDIGGESTRPGAEPVSVQEEMDRVLPVLDVLKDRLDVVLSIDTSTPQVMTESIKSGAHLINDVRAFSRSGAIDAVVDSDVAVCVMHMQGTPQTMQDSPKYYSVLEDVKSYLGQRVQCLQNAGVASERIIVDPGFGFGKTLQHNLLLLDGLPEIAELEYPMLIGMSRKTMIGQILDKDVDERLIGSVAAAVLAAQNGGHIFRVHDVAETVDALKVVSALRRLLV